MSGGSWDYVYSRVQDAADRLMCEQDPARVALGERLGLMADALHAIEWVDSGDRMPGDEAEAIRKALEPIGAENAVALAALGRIRAALETP